MGNYRTWTVFFAASYQSGSNLQFLASGCMPVVAGIAFMLINVRVGLGWARKSIATVQPNYYSSFVASTHEVASVDHYALHPLHITIDQVVSTDPAVNLENKASQSVQVN